MNERIVAGRTEPPDMREKGKHGARSAGFMERRVIVHRSADRGAVSRRLARSRLVGFICLCLRVSVPLCEKKLRLVLPSALQKIPQSVTSCLEFFLFFLSAFFRFSLFHLSFSFSSIRGAQRRSCSVSQHHVVAVVSGQGKVMGRRALQLWSGGDEGLVLCQYECDSVGR